MDWCGESTALRIGDELVAAKKQHHILCPESLPLISTSWHLDARPSSSLRLLISQQNIRQVGTPNFAFPHITTIHQKSYIFDQWPSPELCAHPQKNIFNKCQAWRWQRAGYQSQGQTFAIICPTQQSTQKLQCQEHNVTFHKKILGEVREQRAGSEATFRTNAPL